MNKNFGSIDIDSDAEQLVPIWVIINVAGACHEVNRAYSNIIGDGMKPVSWDDAPEYQKSSCIKGVIGVIKGNTPRESHESWLAEKIATGWHYGPVKNEASLEHPCMVPYDELLEQQRVKDDLFVQTARSLLKAYGYKF